MTSMKRKFKKRESRCPRCGGLEAIVPPSELRKARQSAKLTLGALAEKSKLSVGHLSDIERGRRRATRKVIAIYQDL